MSFKRDGDDVGLLDDLKRRRVSELLAANIPADEAMLLKNGRYTCTICNCQPIFDTLEILAIHRKGKRHLQNLSSVLNRREQNDFNQTRFKHPANLERSSALAQPMKPSNTGSSSTWNKQKCHLLLKNAPYNSCSRRRAKPMVRKYMIDLKTASVAPTTCEVSTTGSFTQYLKSLQEKERFEDVVQTSRNLCNLASRAPTSEAEVTHTNIHTKTKKCLSFNSLSEEERERVNHDLNLYRDGWKRNVDGTWIKDEQAEFDSDEDEIPVAMTTVTSHK